MRIDGGLASSNMGCPHGHGGARVTRESRMMEERNYVVSAASKAIMDMGVELEKTEADALAQEGFVRRLTQN